MLVRDLDLQVDVVRTDELVAVLVVSEELLTLALAILNVSEVFSPRYGLKGVSTGYLK